MDMGKVILVIGIVFGVIGVLFVIKPEAAVKLMKVIMKGPLVYIPGVLRIALGVVFLVSVRECKIKWVILTFGVLMVVAGVVLLMVKPAKLRAFFEWWTKRSLWVIRVGGLLAVACGGVIAWAA